MDARIILREAENIQNWSLWAFPQYFRLEQFFGLEVLFLYALVGSICIVPLIMACYPIFQVSFGLTFVYLLPILLLSLSTPADKAFTIS